MLASPFHRKQREKKEKREWIHSLEVEHQLITLISRDGAWEPHGNRRGEDIEKQKQDVVRVPLGVGSVCAERMWVMRMCYVAHGWFGIVSIYTTVLEFWQRVPVCSHGCLMKQTKH